MKKAIITDVTGQDVTIRELAETMMGVVGFEGEIVFDASKPGHPTQTAECGSTVCVGVAI